MVRPDGLCQLKIPMTPSGIETATFRLVAHTPEFFLMINKKPFLKPPYPTVNEDFFHGDQAT